MTDKTSVDDIIGIVKTEEPTNSVQLKKEAQLSICEKRGRELEKENEQLKSENNMLKVTIGRNEAYIKRLTETSEWHC